MVKRSLLFVSFCLCSVLFQLHAQDTSTTLSSSTIDSSYTEQHQQQVFNDGSQSTIPSDTVSANDGDYETTVPVSIVITVDNDDFTLSLGAGTRIRTAAQKFVTDRKIDNSYIIPIENAIIKEAKRVYDSMQTSSTNGNNNPSTSSSSSTTADNSKNLVTSIDVNLNADVYSCPLYVNETPQEAARRFCSVYNLANDEEYDSVLRLLINRLRSNLGYTDNLPFTTDNVRTMTVIDVDPGDGTGRLLKLRVLEGETPVEAARGFLDRTGFDIGNVQALTRIIEQKILEQSTSTTTSTLLLLRNHQPKMLQMILN